MKLRFRRPKGIPVGKDGYVPLKEIVKRYQEIGDPRDSNSDDPVILPSMLTPEEIEQWWEDPSVCDIDGVDTKESNIYSVPLSIRRRKRKALKHIAVLADRYLEDCNEERLHVGVHEGSPYKSHHRHTQAVHILRTAGPRRSDDTLFG